MVRSCKFMNYFQEDFYYSWCGVDNKCQIYYRSRIKCPLFVPKTQTPRAGHVQSTPHHTKKAKNLGNFPLLFLIFSMVWGQLLTTPHTRLSWILGMK